MPGDYERGLRRVQETMNNVFQEIQQEDLRKEQKADEQHQEQVKQGKQSNDLAEQQVKIDKRTYCLTVYIAVVTTIAAVPAIILLVQWLSKILSSVSIPP